MYEALKRILPETRLFTNESMVKHTSFQIGGPADVYALPENTEELLKIARECRTQSLPFTLLGGGTNVLVSDAGIRGVVAQVYGLNRIRLYGGGRITAEAGVSLKQLADDACEAGLSGLAFASGIPGTVGGAVYMNAGAYEHAIAEVCESADVLLPDGSVVTLWASDMEFDYRHSILQANGGLVLSATFRLTPGDPASIRAEIDDLNARRARSQPLEYPSAGSTFKRPKGYYAGTLIMECGLKGYTIGGAQVSEKHAGFIINRGGATAKEVRLLIDHIRRTVHTQTGVSLEPEVRLIG